MIADKIQELIAAKERLAVLERAVADEVKRELATLPARFGFKDVSSFVSAVRAATTRRRNPVPLRCDAGVRPKTRAKITDDTRTAVRKLLEEGKSGGEIARRLGISVPSVQNIKKAIGWVKERS